MSSMKKEMRVSYLSISKHASKLNLNDDSLQVPLRHIEQFGHLGLIFFIKLIFFRAFKKETKIVFHCKSVGGKDRFSLIFRDY